PIRISETPRLFIVSIHSSGEREGCIKKYEEALDIFNSALEACSLESRPIYWARTKSNIGISLLKIGTLMHGTVELKNATHAIRAALEVFHAVKPRTEWASVQNNLASALLIIGRRKNSTMILQQALHECRTAVKVSTPEITPFKWALRQENLAIAAFDLFLRTADEEHHKEAKLSIDAALTVYRKAGADYHIEGAERLQARIAAAGE
ncbi:MAG: hypothetical protein AAFR52_10610, partial [Pseudomonadota bacterium]